MSWNYIDLWGMISIRLSRDEPHRYFLDLFAAGSVFVVFLAFLLSLTIFWKRKLAYERLTRAGLPTTYWYPKWISSSWSSHRTIGVHDLSYNVLSSSNITNILPRMLRLRGPYDMYGTVYGASTAVVHVAHPTPAYMILCGGNSTHIIGNPITQKAPAYNHFKNFCGDGVFTADGEDWKNKRAAVLHALLMRHKSTVSETRGKQGETGFYSRIAQEVNCSVSELIDTLDKEILTARQNHNEPTYKTNVVPILQRATIGLIYRYITHNDFMKVEKQQTQIFVPWDSETKAQSFIQKYLQSITRIRMILLAQSRSIWFVLPRWFYRTFAKLYQDEERTLQSIRQMAVFACQQAQPDSPLGQLRYHPVYCATQNKVYAKTMNNHCDDSSANDFSKNLIDEAITLLFAGQDTSAATLSWTLHLLTLYPNVQEALFVEIQSVLKDDSDYDDNAIAGPSITRKHIARMPYLDAIIKESMRLYPVAPFIVRKLSEGVDISPAVPAQRGGIPHIHLPSQSVTCIWIHSLHRHPDFWNRPTEFLPERWIAAQTKEPNFSKAAASTTKDLGITTPGAYIPYAIGARNCLGQPLANIVLRIMLARLIYKYEFQDDRVTAICSKNPTPSEPLSPEQVEHLRRDMQAGFTVLPQGGLPLSIRHRNQRKTLL